ncbi:pyruvate, phosphate dikinase [Xanthobacter oligotrophicus]|uniref:pyruvate, phosphate dikinase n=1 Tax=Xanthobacter oligotrophicus TaxID=2607286 RepID=UPI0011F35B93|nr:pyruvate, phosphate dikinase [Xanthobacter oligotrophicus]MCG5237357.1 pyruvate, phosphate dikinase [Xanthobacter oligotrophicus]
MFEMDMMAPPFVYDIRVLDPQDGYLFGGKATGLSRMASAGIPVPPAFAISTDAFRAFQAGGRQLPADLRDEVDVAMARLGEQVGRVFSGGDTADPLLVSVRSGAQVSMPGMMDTVLNLGLDASSASAMIARGHDRRFVIDSWMRFWKMYVEIVLGLDSEDFLHALSAARAGAEAEGGNLNALEEAVVAYIEDEGEDAPTKPRDQLDRAIAAVFSSWNSPRAKAYREHQGISHDLGTAVTVQAMVFGNADDRSGSGVAFSRDPNTGAPVLYGEYLPGRQGEDIVAGTATPIDLSSQSGRHGDLCAALEEHSRVLEVLYRDAVDIEFTVESGRLYLLQVRPAKRTAAAAVRIAADLAAEGVLTSEEALERVSAEQIKRLLRPVFDPRQVADAQTIATGVGSSPGQASGIAILDSDRAAECATAGDPVILVRPTTSPLDIRGMIAAAGILTAKGGALSHAAVVSRALDRPCVVGCEVLDIDLDARTFSVGGRVWQEGDAIAIDGASGRVFDGRIDLVEPEGQFCGLTQLLETADRLSGASVWTTARPVSGATPAGVAVVNMADVAIAEGIVERFADGMANLAREPEAAAAVLGEAAAGVGAAVLDAVMGLPVHVRLPQPGSRRARFVVPDWLELDQRLFLPLGNTAYQNAIFAGLARSAEGRGPITVLLGGVTDVAEWTRYRRDIAAFPQLEAGVVIQNVAGLEAVPAMLAQAGGRIWIDLDEVIDSAHGFLPKAYASAAVLDEYVAQGKLGSHPRKELKPFLAALFQQAAAQGDERVGVLCPADCDGTLLEWLHAHGFRLFSVPSEQRDLTRALLGKAAGRRVHARVDPT